MYLLLEDCEMNSLIYDLRTEADLCRNETADDIAALLDKAADEITRLLNIEFAAKMISQDYQANRFSHDSMITMIEALRHNAELTGGRSNG